MSGGHQSTKKSKYWRQWRGNCYETVFKKLQVWATRTGEVKDIKKFLSAGGYCGDGMGWVQKVSYMSKCWRDLRPYMDTKASKVF